MPAIKPAEDGHYSKTRILYIETTPGWGGSVSGLYRLLQGLDRDKYEPLVMLHVRQPLTPMFQELGVEVVKLPTPFAKVVKPQAASATEIAQPIAKLKKSLYWSARFYLWFIRRSLPAAWPIRNIMLQKRVDAAHLNDDIASNRVQIASAALAGVPCLAHIRAFYEPRGIDRLLSRFVTYCIYMSGALEAYTIERLPSAKGSIVYDGLTQEYFDPLPDKLAARKEFGLEPEDFVVGSLGRLVEWKGQKVLLRALAEVAPHVPHLKCLVLGSPIQSVEEAYLQELKAMVATLSLERVVQFAGYRSDVRGALAAMDILVHSSSEPEPFGLVIIEAMAARKPVIATAGGGVLDIIDDGVTGILVPIHDSPSMARAIRSLVDSGPAFRQQLGEAARRSVMERFTVRSYAKGIMDIYDQVLPRYVLSERHALRRPSRL